MLRKTMALVFCAGLLCAGGVSAAYIEGTDTTDVNGYSRDSAFRVTSTTITGQNIVRYRCDQTSTGYFNYAFDDIKMAPDSNKSVANATGMYCFVIKKTRDNTYSKVQILNRLPDTRYVFKYGTNTVPNDHMLASATYDHSVRYKPNNFNNIFEYYCMPGYDICQRNTSSWEPPLPNNNHLLGYIYYRAKMAVSIDTTAPINIAQWDSIAFITSTSYVFSGQPVQYFNLVALYAEGKSDFLLGWSRRTDQMVGVQRNSPETEIMRNNIEIKKAIDGFFITLSSVPHTAGHASLSIYNMNGVKVAGFSDIKNNQVFWKTTDRNLAEGQYIVKLELPDKSVISRTLVFSRI
jgi:hypothetical protein